MVLTRTVSPCILMLVCLSATPGQSFAHGYVEGSRNKLCAEAVNRNCGAVRYEPQSVEGPDRFPATGPADGTLAAAGSATWAPLNEQSPSRWHKTAIAAGANTFHWHFTANHVSGDFRYFITRPGWDQSAPLSRSQFETEPFCLYDGGFLKPDVDTYHDCIVPERQGYHVILAVWDVGDTDASFYNAIDVNFLDGSTNVAGPFDANQNPATNLPTGPATAPSTDPATNPPTTPVASGTGPDGGAGSEWVDVGDIEPAMALRAGDQIVLRSFSDIGELAGSEIGFSIFDDAAGAINRWPTDLAQHVNGVSRLLQVGTRQGDMIGVTGGRQDIFATPASGVTRVEIEYRLAERPANSGGGMDPVTEVTEQYPAMRGQYENGTVVVGQDGHTYMCLVAGWCNISSAYYASGFGLAWSSAWQLDATAAVPVAPVSAQYQYPAGRGRYVAGTVITGADGLDYRCRIPAWCNSTSELYYAPASGLAFGEAWTRL